MDLILVGAEIRDAPFRAACGGALGVSTGRIAALGEAAQVLPRRVRGTRVIRLRGGTLLPGFVDAHLHFRALARRRVSLDAAAADAADLLRRIATAARGGTGWLFAHGLEHRRPGFGALPTLAELDRVTRGRPLWLRHRSGHLSLLNSAALGALGWAERDPPLGTMERQAGRPSGVVYDAEPEIGRLLRERHPPAAPGEIAETARALLRLGTTAFADLTAANAAPDLDTWRADYEAGRIPQALSLWVAQGSLRGRAHPGAQDAVRWGGIKVLPSLRSGGLAPPVEELAEVLGWAARAGWPVAIHAVEGDALAHTLEALRRAAERPPHRLPALRLEHLNLPPPPLVEALASYRVDVCVQPGLLWVQGAVFRESVPRAQWPWLFPLASLARSARLALGSDAPAAPQDLLCHAAAACARRDAEGHRWNAGERLTPEAALTAITRDAARLAGLADLTGRLGPGARADAVYFKQDWRALRRALEAGQPPRPAATLCAGVWHDWR